MAATLKEGVGKLVLMILILLLNKIKPFVLIVTWLKTREKYLKEKPSGIVSKLSLPSEITLTKPLKNNF